MAEQKVSARYASSLLDSAIQKNFLDTISSDVDLVVMVIDNNPNLKRMLENPIIRPEIKVSIIEEIFKDKISSDTMEFLLFVIKKKREEILFSILEKFKELRDLELGYVNVNVVSASDFTDSQKRELEDKLQIMLQKKIRMKYRVDEKILGGFIVQAGDTVFNASIKHQLGLLRKHFTEASQV